MPAGYSTKNWDPAEGPFILLGSVFDANSLGKWIYDWTVFSHSPATPLAYMAGELWLLLIQLASKIKRAEDVLSWIRKRESIDLVEDFLESREGMWIRVARLLKVCKDAMLEVAKRRAAGGGEGSRVRRRGGLRWRMIAGARLWILFLGLGPSWRGRRS
jgi:hypothetical protein